MRQETEQTRQPRAWWGGLLGGLAGLLALTAMACLVIWMLGVKKTSDWDEQVQALREAGEPVTFEELSAMRPPLADEDNGALVLMELKDELEQARVDAKGKPVFLLGTTETKRLFDGVVKAEVDSSRRFRDAHQNLLDRLEALRDKSQGRFSRDLDQIISDTSFSVGRLARTAAKFCAFDATVDLTDGDLESACGNIHLIWNCGGTLKDDLTLISCLVRLAVDMLALREIEDALRTGELPDALIVQLAERLDGQATDGRFGWALRCERTFSITFFERALDGTLPPGPATTSYGNIVPSWVPTLLLRQNEMTIVDLMNELIDAADDPSTLVNAAKRVDEKVQSLSRMNFLARMVMPSLQRCAILNARLLAETHSARMALAAERYRLANGSLPDSIEELVPDYIEAVPIDPFDGKPLRFKKSEDGIVIYSVHENLIDDGGRLTEDESGNRMPDVGSRLLHPEKRGLVFIEIDAEEGQSDTD